MVWLTLNLTKIPVQLFCCFEGIIQFWHFLWLVWLVCGCGDTSLNLLEHFSNLDLDSTLYFQYMCTCMYIQIWLWSQNTWNMTLCSNFARIENTFHRNNLVIVIHVISFRCKNLFLELESGGGPPDPPPHPWFASTKHRGVSCLSTIFTKIAWY